MKAIVVEKFGNVNGLVLKEVKNPIISNGEILIKVKAFGLNPVDYKTRQGGGIASKMQNPIILGWEIAGIVEEVSTNSKFKVGDRVFGMINFPGQGNAYAEYVKAMPEHLAIIPENISFEIASSAPLASLTAYQTLVKYAKIKKNDKVLIHAGAGGVGHIAIQIAKNIGAYVISTASKRNEKFLKELGVDEFIDYTSSKFQDIVSNVDIVLDCVGGDVGLNSLQTLRQGGIMISIPSPFNPELNNKRKDIDTPWILVQSNGDDMNKISELLKDEKIKVHIQKTYKMNEIKDAHNQLETRKTRGKLIVKI
ncbi:MAG TPA: NADP-dependent oxidoreductase [Crocinitomix sp.]|nr:NADP-dependent oxidoreductase [Crocinitomix sp.]